MTTLLSILALLFALIGGNEPESTRAVLLPLVGRIPSRPVAPAQFRAWQGVAVDSMAIYLFTDRNEHFILENIITVLSHDGAAVYELRDAYTGTDSAGRFMSFGDGNIIDGMLYITAYNINGGGLPPYESRILIYGLPGLGLIEEHDIGAGVAESATRHDGTLWVAYHDRQELCQFDADFQPLGCLMLSEPRGIYGGYQGAYWDGDCIYLQMHGPNRPGQVPAKGLDKYCLQDEQLVFQYTESPLAYGAGQGVALHDGRIYQNGRPENAVYIGAED